MLSNLREEIDIPTKRRRGALDDKDVNIVELENEIKRLEDNLRKAVTDDDQKVIEETKQSLKLAMRKVKNLDQPGIKSKISREIKKHLIDSNIRYRMRSRRQKVIRKVDISSDDGEEDNTHIVVMVPYVKRRIATHRRKMMKGMKMMKRMKNMVKEA